MRRTTTLLAAAAMALIAAGCSDSTAPKDQAHVGRYGLVSVDGETLPLTLVDDPTLKLTLTEGALTINANSTFTQEVTLDVVANGFPAAPERLSCGGSYTRRGNTFTLTGNETANCSGMTATGVLDGNTMTVSDDQGETLVFRR
jgi:hypothetical protein